MKYRSLALALLFSLVAPTGALAQCDFNAPAKAKGIKADMVRAFVPCGNSITLPAPNSSTMAGTPTCTPVTPRSGYRFGPKGSCKLLLTQRLEAPCLNGCGFDCANVYLRVKCKGLETPAGIPLSAADVGWALSIVVRATLNDSSSGDMTTIDSPVLFAFPPPVRGKLRLDVNTETSGTVDPCFGGPTLGACAALELLSARLIAPDSFAFATIGASTR